MNNSVQDDIRRYEKGLEEARKLGDRRAEAKWLSNLAAAHSTVVSVIDFGRAARCSEQARKIYRELRNWLNYERESLDLAAIYEYEEGFNDPWRALEVCEDTLNSGGIYISESYREKFTRRIAWLKGKLNRQRGY